MEEDFPGGLVIKNQPANAGVIRDTGSIPGSKDSLEEGMATHSSILSQRIPWTEEPDGLQSKGSQKTGHNRATTYTHTKGYESGREVILPGLYGVV